MWKINVKHICTHVVFLHILGELTFLSCFNSIINLILTRVKRELNLLTSNN